jgi:2,7-dihydroxy-5-methyl-1-naphthoate 7-O-methyltransferase
VSAQDRLRDLSDFAAPWAVWIAATLRLPDHIEAGATRLEELSDRARAEPDALKRLLRYLVARGVFAETAGRYENTELSQLLLNEGGWRQWLDLDGAPGVWAKSWTRLVDGIRTGSPGSDESWFYDELARTGRGASFDALMAAQVSANAEQIAACYDWRSIERVVDVGGGTGVLLRTLLAAHEHLHGTLFDLPQVVEPVEPAERLTIVPGNLFDDTLPTADAHILSQIIHGWPDTGAAHILRRCTEVAPRILLVEGVLPERPSASDASFDLFMFTLTGGRQRTTDEFRRLAESVGLELLSTHPLATGDSLIELHVAR